MKTQRDVRVAAAEQAAAEMGLDHIAWADLAQRCIERSVREAPGGDVVELRAVNDEENDDHAA